MGRDSMHTSHIKDVLRWMSLTISQLGTPGDGVLYQVTSLLEGHSPQRSQKPHGRPLRAGVSYLLTTPPRQSHATKRWLFQVGEHVSRGELIDLCYDPGIQFLPCFQFCRAYTQGPSEDCVPAPLRHLCICVCVDVLLCIACPFLWNNEFLDLFVVNRYWYTTDSDSTSMTTSPWPSRRP